MTIAPAMAMAMVEALTVSPAVRKPIFGNLFMLLNGLERDASAALDLRPGLAAAAELLRHHSQAWPIGARGAA